MNSMSVSSMDSQRPAGSDPADDIIDLRRYVGVLGSWWKEIVLIAVLTAMAAGLGYWLLTASDIPVYTAASDVALVRTVSEVTFDERFTTQSETVPAGSVASRRAALLALAEQPALAVDVIAELGEALPEELRTPAALADAVSAALATSESLRTDSDLIRITATSTSAEVAAQIATSWARAYVRNVNQVYGQVPNDVLESVEQERSAAEATYQAAQTALEGYRARSRIDELSRQIADIDQQLNSLRRGRQTTFGSLVERSVEGRDLAAQAISEAMAENLTAPYVKEQEARREIVLAAIDALYQGQVQVISEQARRDQELLSGYYTRWLQMTRSLQEAEALRAQVAALTDETAPGSSVLVLSLLKLQSLTQALDPVEPPQLDVVAEPNVRVTAQAADSTSASAAPGMVQSTQPVQVQVGATPLQLQLDDRAAVSREALLADADALIDALSARITALEGQIDGLSEQILNGDGYEHLGLTVPAGSALAQAIQSQGSAIVGGTIFTGTAAAVPVNSGDLAALYRFDDLQALADAADGDQPLAETIAGMEEAIRFLDAALEAERAEETRLTQERDLALQALGAINSKSAELTLLRAAGSSEVRFAAPAVPPVNPIGRLSWLLVAAAAGVAGFFMGVLVAFVADAMGRRPFLSRRPAAARAA